MSAEDVAAVSRPAGRRDPRGARRRRRRGGDDPTLRRRGQLVQRPTRSPGVRRRPPRRACRDASSPARRSTSTVSSTGRAAAHSCSHMSSAASRSAARVVIAAGGGKGGAHLGIRQAARECSVAVVPQLGGEVAAVLIDDQLHECAGVEIDHRHRSASLLTDEFSDRATRARSGPPLRRRPSYLRWPGDHAVDGEAFEHRSRTQPGEPGDRYPTLGDDDLFASIGAGEPITEMRSKFGHGDVHSTSVQFEPGGLYVLAVDRRIAPGNGRNCRRPTCLLVLRCARCEGSRSVVGSGRVALEMPADRRLADERGVAGVQRRIN